MKVWQQWPQFFRGSMAVRREWFVAIAHDWRYEAADSEGIYGSSGVSRDRDRPFSVGEPPGADMRTSLRKPQGGDLNCAFGCREADGRWSLTFESRGGRKRSRTARNPDYAEGLKLLLTRLGERRFILVDAVVESAAVRRAGLAEAQRRLDAGVSSYPVRLTPAADVESIAASLRRSQASVGQSASARGGNTTKRIRLTVAADELTLVPEEGLEEFLALGTSGSRTNADWWVGHPDERYWLEITNRSDIGRNLNAPAMDKNGDANWSYLLVRAVRPGDIVLHYDTRCAAIVGASRVVGEPWQDAVVWAARGTRSRRAGIKPHRQLGWYVGLEEYVPLESPINISAIAALRNDIFAVREELRRTYGDPIRFPFVPYGASGIRAFQAYLVKFPQRLFNVFPELRKLPPPGVIPITSQPASVDADSLPGGAYRTANEELSVGQRDPFQVDPEHVERGLRGHAQTQNALAAFVSDLGVDPKSPVAGDPNFDLLWEVGERVFVAEVKSVTPANEEKQLRLGLGQVMRYRQLLAARTGKEIVAVLVIEREPTDDTWAELCRSLGVLLTWPAALHQLPVG